MRIIHRRTWQKKTRKRKQKRVAVPLKQYQNRLKRGELKIIDGQEVIILKDDDRGDSFIAKRNWKIMSAKRSQRYAKK